MSLHVILGLGIGSYLLRAVGLILVAGGRLPTWTRDPLRMLPPAVLAALVVTQLYDPEVGLELDASWVGVAGAVAVLWWRRSLIGAMGVAVAITALLRWMGA